MQVQCPACGTAQEISEPADDGYQRDGDREVVIVQCSSCGERFEAASRNIAAEDAAPAEPTAGGEI